MSSEGSRDREEQQARLGCSSGDQSMKKDVEGGLEEVTVPTLERSIQTSLS